MERVYFQGAVVVLQRGAGAPQVFIGATEVDEREIGHVLAVGLGGLFQPGNGFFPAAQFDEIGADVVVWVAEGGVKVNSLPTLFDGFLVAGEKAVGPTEVSVRFGGGVGGDGLPIEVNGVSKLPVHLMTITALQQN